MPQPRDWWGNIMDPLRQIGDRVAEFFAPEAEAAATDAYYEIAVELPGVKEEDIEISLHNHILAIKGEKKSERVENGKSYYFSERRFGRFHRSFRVPEEVEADQIAARFADGVLTIIVPKTKPKAEKVRTISINKC